MAQTPIKLLIAASGTGGHLFPAIAVARKLSDYQIEWLGVPDRMETELIPKYSYPLNTIPVTGLQGRLGLGTIKIIIRLITSILITRKLLQEKKFHGVFTTGGYIAAPAIIAARSLGLPVILHESNALPGKVTRWFSPWCTIVALGFANATQFLPRAKTIFVGTPVRDNFTTNNKIDLPIPENVPLIVISGGSQGAIAINKLVRQCAAQWLEKGAWIVHQTGASDTDIKSFQHPHYFAIPFYDNMAGLFQRANLVISRAGAGTLTELAITKTPSILVPYPYAAEDHQAFNAKVFAQAGAALVFPQAELTAQLLESTIIDLLDNPEKLQEMTEKTATLAVPNSAELLVNLLGELVKG